MLELTNITLYSIYGYGGTSNYHSTVRGYGGITLDTVGLFTPINNHSTKCGQGNIYTVINQQSLQRMLVYSC